MAGKAAARVARQVTALSKQLTLRDAIAKFVPDECSVALGLQMEQMIPFAAGHEIIRQKKHGLTLIGPVSDILFDQLIGAGGVRRVIAAWVGNVMMGSAYNFRRAVEEGGLAVTNLTNFSVALALQAAAMGVPFLPARTALGSDIAENNEFFARFSSPFTGETLHAVRALAPDVAIVHVQRADVHGNAHCWGNFGVMLEGMRAARTVIVCAEEIVAPDVISSDPNRTVIPGFMVSAVAEVPGGAHPSPVQGYYNRDDDAFRQYHEDTRSGFASWAQRWIHDVPDRAGYLEQVGRERLQQLQVKNHVYAAAADFGF